MDLPDPGAAGTPSELTAILRALKVFAGDPSFTVITDRVNRAWRAEGRPAAEDTARGTVVDCFKPGRRRLNADLIVAIVRALHDDAGYADQWRQALRTAAGLGTAQQVRVSDALPPALAGFTGRRAELARLDHLASGRTGVVVSIEGMAGVGKTQLAVHQGHRLLRRGRVARVLHVNLRGFHPAQPSANPAAVLDGFLRLLGIPGSQVPRDPAERGALYRERLAGKPTLVVLDDAADDDQVRPLLGDVPGGVTLITSRRRLGAAHSVPLDVFTVDETRAYLSRTVRQLPAGDDPDAVDRLARRCGGLPLALSLVTGHMRAMPGWTLSDHAERLDERHMARRLDSGLDITLGQSYDRLAPGHRRLFRLLAVHPGPDLDAHAAAALAGLEPSAAAAVLADLRRDHLIGLSGTDRFVLHDLVRVFADARSVDEDSPAARREALTRLRDHYTATAIAAGNRLHPDEVGMQWAAEKAGASTVPLHDERAARRWLDTERPVLVTVTGQAAAGEQRWHAVELSVALFRYLIGHPGDAVQLHGNVRDAARRAGDIAGEATALLGVGAAYCVRGDVADGAEVLRRALELFRSVGDRLGEARAQHNLGNAAVWQGRPAVALTHLSAALSLFRDLSESVGAAHALTSMGFTEYLMGRHASAVEHLEPALAAYRETGNPAQEAIVLTNLGMAENGLGRPDRAAAHLEHAVTLARQLGDRITEANALEGLARTAIRTGQPARALPSLDRALTLCREVGYRRGEAETLIVLGDVARDTGDPATARTHYEAALAVVGSSPDQQARARAGLAHSQRDRPRAAGTTRADS